MYHFLSLHLCLQSHTHVLSFVGYVYLRMYKWMPPLPPYDTNYKSASFSVKWIKPIGVLKVSIMTLLIWWHGTVLWFVNYLYTAGLYKQLSYMKSCSASLCRLCLIDLCTLAAMECMHLTSSQCNINLVYISQLFFFSGRQGASRGVTSLNDIFFNARLNQIRITM